MVKLYFSNPVTHLNIPGSNESYPVESENLPDGGCIVTCTEDSMAYLPLLHGTASLVEPAEFEVNANLMGVWFHATFRPHGVRQDIPRDQGKSKIFEGIEEERKRLRGRPRKASEPKEWLPRNEGGVA